MWNQVLQVNSLSYVDAVFVTLTDLFCGEFFL